MSNIKIKSAKDGAPPFVFDCVRKTNSATDDLYKREVEIWGDTFSENGMHPLQVHTVVISSIMISVFEFIEAHASVDKENFGGSLNSKEIMISMINDIEETCKTIKRRISDD